MSYEFQIIAILTQIDYSTCLLSNVTCINIYYTIPVRKMQYKYKHKINL